jgi:hypothetical protein
MDPARGPHPASGVLFYRIERLLNLGTRPELANDLG